MIERPGLRLPSRSAISRRRLLLTAGAAAAAATLGGREAEAVLKLDITQGTIQPVPVAIPDFLTGTGGDPELARNLSGIITNNLRRSGLFQPIDPNAFIERIQNFDARPRFPDWRVINAQGLVTGRVSRDGDRTKTEFRLWDVFAGEQLAGQQYFITQPAQWRRIGHIISDLIYERLTGEKGYFDTRIVFIDETGPKDQRVKRLAIMDQDGANVRYLTRGEDLVLTPRFSPTNQEVAYMSYGRGDPRVLLLNIDTGQREVVGDFPGMTFSPRFSPDGQRVALIEPAEGLQLEHLSPRSSLAADHPAHRCGGDRHGAVVLARWTADRIRIRPRRLAADLRHGCRRHRCSTHLVRPGRHLLDARMVAARGRHCVHAAGSR